MAILALDTLALVPFAYIRATGKALHYTLIKLINVGVIVIVQLFALRWIPHWIETGKAIPQFLINLFTATEKVEYIFIANLLGSAISLILVLPYLFKFKWTWSSHLWKKMLAYSYPIVIAGIAYVINENLDKWLLGSMINKETEGLYAAAYKLAIFMNLYIMAFRLGAEPFFFSISSDKNAPKTYAIVMKYFVLIGSLALIAIVLLMDIFKHFINPAYWEALKIVPIVLLANLFLGIYHNLSIWYKLTDRTRFGMLFSIIGALITIGFNLYFIPKIGFMAAAWATVGGKYGTKLAVNFANWYGLDAKYNPEFERMEVNYAGIGDTYFRDLNFEVRKKFSKNLSGIFTYVNSYYNQAIIEEKGDIVKLNVAVAEATYKLKPTQSIRLEGQHLWTKQDKKNWAAATAEFNMNTNWSIFVNDMYNYGYEKILEDENGELVIVKPKDHYYNVGLAYNKNRTSVALRYGRTRGGLLCVGGVCRDVPAATGLTCNITTSF
jgi:hypothetical protein